MSTVTLKTALEFIEATRPTGRVFAIEFIKRSTGEVRIMNCRLGVKKHLKGGPKAFDDSEHRLITVFDMAKVGYRCIAVEGIQRIEMNGLWYDVLHAKQKEVA